MRRDEHPRILTEDGPESGPFRSKPNGLANLSAQLWQAPVVFVGNRPRIRRQPLIESRVEDRVDECFLSVEVLVENRPGQACSRGDVVDCGAFEAILGEAASGGRDDALLLTEHSIFFSPTHVYYIYDYR